MRIKRLTLLLLFFALYFFPVKGCTPSFKTVMLTAKNKLSANDGAANDHFGISVGITGERAIVGARGEIERGRQSGAAYIFKYTGIGWMQETKLVARVGRTNNHFGASVSISGDRVIVGAPGDSEKGIPSGSAYVFRYNGVRWELEAKLVARDGRARDEFGASVSISGEGAIVGAPGDDDRGNQSGSAYVFKYTGTDWVQEVRLIVNGERRPDLHPRAVGHRANAKSHVGRTLGGNFIPIT